MDYIIFWRELSQISLKTLQTFTEEEVARIFGRAAYDLDLFYAEKKVFYIFIVFFEVVCQLVLIHFKSGKRFLLSL
jgi:hypothetical protein